MIKSSHPEAAGMAEAGVFAASRVLLLLGNGQLVATVASLLTTRMNLAFMKDCRHPVRLFHVMAT